MIPIKTIEFKPIEEFDRDLALINEELIKGENYLRTAKNIPLNTILEFCAKKEKLFSAFQYILLLKNATYPPPPPVNGNGKGKIIEL